MKYYKLDGKAYTKTRDIARILNMSLPYELTQEQCDSLGIELCDTAATQVEPTLDEVKTQRIQKLKNARDTQEVEPIEYNGKMFDYDDKARDRINTAIIALTLQGDTATIDWTTADNEDVAVTANDLRMVIAAVAVRSNKLHVAYRKAREAVEAAETKEEVETINLVLAE